MQKTRSHSSFFSRYFGDAAFYRMVLSIAIPIMIQNGITNFVGLLDNIMIGSVGTLEMGGVGVANQLLFVFNLSIFGAISGAGIFGAQFFGKGDYEGVRHSFRFKLMIGLFLLVVGFVVFTLLDTPLISLYLKGTGTDADRAATLAFAREYLHIMLWGLPPWVLACCYAGTLRESGITVVPMVAGVISVLVNLCLNALLIFGLLGFPQMGIAGAAYATVIARICEATIVVVWAHLHMDRAPYIRGAYRTFVIPRALLGNIIRKTVPLMMNETLWAAGIAVLNMCYSMHSLDVVPAQSISSTVSNVFNIAMMALGNAVGIIVGQLLGAGKMDEAVDTDRKLITFSFVICVAIGAVMAVCAPYIPLIYNATNAVQSLAASFIVISALCMPMHSVANACYFTLRSGGKTIITFLFDSCYVCLVSVPLAFILTKFTSLDIVPLFLCCQLVDIGKCIVGLWMIKKGFWIQNIVSETQGV